MRLMSCLFLSLLCAAPALAVPGPEEVVRDFYTARLQKPELGAPSGRVLAEYSSHLGPELVCLLGAALRYQDRLAEARPGDKAPFDDLDLYSSGGPVPTRFTLGALQQQKGGRASLTVRFHADADGQPDVQGWEDRVHLKIYRRDWVISDIEYLGNPAGAKQGSLDASLQRGLAGAAPVAGWNAQAMESCTLDSRAPAKRGKAAKGKKGSKAKAVKGRTTAKAGARTATAKKGATAKKSATAKKPASKKRR